MQPDMCMFPLSEAEQVTAEAVKDGASEKAPEGNTVNTVPPLEEEVSVSTVNKGAGGEVLYYTSSYHI